MWRSNVGYYGVIQLDGPFQYEGLNKGSKPRRVHIGDTANLVTTYAVDAKHIRIGQVLIEPQVDAQYSSFPALHAHKLARNHKV